MYFFSRNTFMHRYVVSISSSLLYCCSLLVLVLMSGAWYFLLYCPLRRVNEQYVKQLVQLHTTVSQLQLKHDEKKNIDELYEDLKQQLHNEKQATLSYDQRMVNMFDIISSAHLFLKIYTPLKDIDKKWYTKKVVEYSLEGNFENLSMFFEKLAQLNMVVQSKQLVITSLGDGLLSVRTILDFIQLKNECCS